MYLKILVFLFFILSTTPQLSLASGEHEQEHDKHHGAEEKHQIKGAHGGKVLQEALLKAEVAIVEKGIPPEFRVWLSLDGAALDGSDLDKSDAKAALEEAIVQISVERLGGQSEIIQFEKQHDYWRGTQEVYEPHSFELTLMVEVADKSYRWQWSSHEGRIQIEPQMAQKNGLSVARVTGGTIEKRIRVYGRLKAPPQNIAMIQARFPGQVHEVMVNIGDTVKKGDSLAVIESNESLQRYALRAPIDGLIQNRQVNVGEITGNNTLFKIINDQTLWADLEIFHGQREWVKVNQKVQVSDADNTYTSQIAHILPGTLDKPHVTARVPFDNSQKNHSPGDLVSADVSIDNALVAMRVDNRALQSFRDWTVVFIKVGNTYEVRPIDIGRTDSQFSEVLSGLNPGDEYVVENSYLIKADIEKSAAEHDH